MRKSPLMSPHQPCSLYTTWWVLFHVSVVHEASMLETEALCASFGSSLTEEDASSFDKNMEKDTRQQAKNTHPRTTHWLPPSLCVLQDLDMSLSAWDSHFPPLLAICSLCCGTLSCLWLQNFHKVARIVYLSLLKKKKEKENEKLWRTESGCCLDSHLGPLCCLVTRVFILNSCVCWSSETKEMSSSTLPQHGNTTSYTSNNSSC